MFPSVSRDGVTLAASRVWKCVSGSGELSWREKHWWWTGCPPTRDKTPSVLLNINTQANTNWPSPKFKLYDPKAVRPSSMELYAAGLNAWNQLRFGCDEADTEPDDLHTFTCVLADDDIRDVRRYLSWTTGQSYCQWAVQPSPTNPPNSPHQNPRPPPSRPPPITIRPPPVSPPPPPQPPSHSPLRPNLHRSHRLHPYAPPHPSPPYPPT